MRIAFVFAPFDHKKFEEDIDIVSREFAEPPPLGLAYAAAIAERHGHGAVIIDANVRPRLTKEQVLKQVREFGAEMLGFLLTAYMFRQTLEWIKYLKENTGLPVVVGNNLMELYPDEVMSNREIDYGIIGPAVKPFPALLSALETGGDISGIKGLCYKRNGEVHINGPETLREDFSVLPHPARHLLFNHRYNTAISKRRNFTVMMASKGCPSKCTFCHVGNIPYSAREPDDVLSEIEECYLKYGIREIEFFDPSFTVDRKRIIEICRGMQERNLDIHWACRARVDQVDEELLEEMAKAGCKRVYYGIESGVQTILDRVNKGITLDKIRRAVDLTKKKGIMTLGFFLVGNPGETKDDVEESIKFAIDLDLDYVQFHKIVPKPTTPFHKQLTEETGFDYWREYVLGNVEERRLPCPWADMSDEEIEKYVIKAYRRFYYRPKRILKILAGVKSPNEFMRYARSAVGFLTVKSDLKR